MVTVILIKDGVKYSDPSQIRIPRNAETEVFYRMVENYVPKINKKE